MKNFLDDHPQDWSNSEYEELRDLLVVCAGERMITLQQLAARAGLTSGTFPVGYDSVRTTTTELIKGMGLQGKLRRLVEVAAREDTFSTDIQQQFAGMLTLPPRPGGSGPVPPPPVPPGPRDIPAGQIRDLLMEAFNAEDLRRLFVYTSDPTLRDLTKEFSSRDGLADMVDKVVGYCQRQDVVPELLAEVKEANPRRYARWESHL